MLGLLAEIIVKMVYLAEVSRGKLDLKGYQKEHSHKMKSFFVSFFINLQ
jgi:hypothetical protein